MIEMEVANHRRAAERTWKTSREGSISHAFKMSLEEGITESRARADDRVMNVANR